MPLDPFPFILILEGIIFLAAGWITGRFPPRKINLIYGYRTQASMASPERWDFAQEYAHREMFRGGLYFIAAGVLLSAIPFTGHWTTELGIVFVATIWVCIWLYRKTEAAISARFTGQVTDSETSPGSIG